MRTVRVLNFKMFGELRQITLGIMNGCGVLFWAVVLLRLVLNLEQDIQSGSKSS